MTAPLWFLRYGDDDDVRQLPQLASILAGDPDPVVHLAVGTLLKHAGARNPDMVSAFLHDHAADLPGAVLRSGASKLPPDDRALLLGAARNR